MRYFFYPKLEGGFTPHPREPHFLRTFIDRQMTFVREQQRCLYLNRRLPACSKHKHELDRDRHSEGFGNTADDICAADAANSHMSTGVGGKAGDYSKDSGGGTIWGLWPLWRGGGGDGCAAGLGLCLPEAARRHENSSDSRHRKRSEAVSLKSSLCYLPCYLNSGALL